MQNFFKNRNIFLLIFSRRMSFKYPEPARDESIKDTYFGTEVTDPYRWLEDPDSEETQAYVNAQNAITRPYLESCPHKLEIKKKITQLWNYPKMSTPFLHGTKYYQFRNTGLQDQGIIYTMDKLDDEGKIFLNPNTFSEDGTVALSGTSFSEDGKTFAYGLSSSGSDWVEIKFRNVETGKDHDEILTKVKYSPMAWMHDNIGFFYGGYLHQTGKTDGSETKSSEYQKLYYHRLGTDQSKDVMAVEFDDHQLRMGAHVSHCGDYLIVTPIKGCKNNLLYFTKFNSTRTVEGKLELTPIVTSFEADYEYVTNVDTKFYFRTNKNAPNYRIIVIDIENPSEDNWKNLIPEHTKDVLDWAHIVNNNMLVVCYLRDVKNAMSIYDLNTGKKIHDFQLDVGSVSAITAKRYHKEMFYSFCSFLTPNIIYKVTFEDEKIKETLWHETKVGDFNSSLYETQQVFYKSKDGTEIPMFIVNKKGLVRDGSKPCLLYGYGGFNVNLTPAFGVTRLVFINNFDGIFALANIRGGGEYGDTWHNGGRFGNKQNCFDDFQYAAKYLVEQNYTKVNKLTIQGGSNGGLLVAACINQAPHLFGAAICQVGVLDMLRYHKFTIGYAWKSDYGSSEEEDQFKYLYKYSPLHNIHIPQDPSQQYPATLLMTADHDDRVVPLHSLKFIAELQHRAGKSPFQTNPLMIRIETKAGHGAGKPTSKVIDEVTDYLAFISKSLSLKFIE
ncbi:prolyl endopeptidase isoform X1 [Diabrotica undecimpunctata]|uniref:prolyl endopeptidase isoform X1 n=2 Tax=Diabrotica undecimpunctata TaxID=50387 RepID=UPI003B6390B4